MIYFACFLLIVDNTWKEIKPERASEKLFIALLQPVEFDVEGAGLMM